MIGPGGHKLGLSANIFLPTYSFCQNLSEKAHIIGSDADILS